jgi:hypothetical protein
MPPLVCAQAGAACVSLHFATTGADTSLSCQESAAIDWPLLATRQPGIIAARGARHNPARAFSQGQNRPMGVLAGPESAYRCRFRGVSARGPGGHPWKAKSRQNVSLLLAKCSTSPGRLGGRDSAEALRCAWVCCCCAWASRLCRSHRPTVLVIGRSGLLADQASIRASRADGSVWA